MLVTLDEAKQYLNVDYEDDDSLINGLINTGENLCIETLGRPFKESDLIDGVLSQSVLYCVAYMYEHRENANMDFLTKNLRYMLSTKREAPF